MFLWISAASLLQIEFFNAAWYTCIYTRWWCCLNHLAQKKCYWNFKLKVLPMVPEGSCSQWQEVTLFTRQIGFSGGFIWPSSASQCSLFPDIICHWLTNDCSWLWTAVCTKPLWIVLSKPTRRQLVLQTVGIKLDLHVPTSPCFTCGVIHKVQKCVIAGTISWST